MPTLEELRFPIGKFTRSEVVSHEQFDSDVKEIEALPFHLRNAIKGLDEKQLDTPYREGGWTVRQVVHHLFDSHVNSYIRLKLALTEDNPTIKPYEEAHWAELHDAKNAPTELSLNMLDSLHNRWALILHSLTPEQRKRTFNHPESGVWGMDENAGLYAWHCKHHVAHITGLREREWNGNYFERIIVLESVHEGVLSLQI